MASHEETAQEDATERPLRKLLVVGRASSESESLLADLQGREDFELIRAVTLGHAETALRDLEVSLAIACPDLSAAAVEDLLAVVERTRRGVPLLAIRNGRSDERTNWAELGIGVLRSPLVAGALSRCIEVVLVLKAIRSSAREVGH